MGGGLALLPLMAANNACCAGEMSSVMVSPGTSACKYYHVALI
jgi:hypothetical protein